MKFEKKAVTLAKTGLDRKQTQTHHSYSPLTRVGADLRAAQEPSEQEREDRAKVAAPPQPCRISQVKRVHHERPTC